MKESVQLRRGQSAEVLEERQKQIGKMQLNVDLKKALQEFNNNEEGEEEDYSFDADMAGANAERQGK